MKIQKVILVFVMAMFLMACNREEKRVDTGEMSKQELDDLIEKTKDDDLPVVSEKENQENIKEAESEEVENKIIRNYELIVWDETITGIKMPTGVLCRDNDLLVLDAENNSLVKLDYSSKLLARIGKLGGAELEFQTPTGITEKEKNVYIIDSNNGRVQILDEKLAFIKEIKKLERNTFDGTEFQSIAADSDGNIYLAGNLIMERKIVWKMSEDKSESVLDNFYGTVCNIEDSVYALNRGQVFVEPTKKTIGIGYGKNILFSLDDGIAKNVAELPDNLGVLTFCVKDNKIYIVSHAQQAVMCFDMSGAYIGTVGKLLDIDKKEQEFYIDVDYNGTVYVARPEKARIDVYR